jgi:hypothetical protein
VRVRHPGALVAGALLSVVADGATSAHWVTPDQILADLNSPQTRAALGVSQATRDERTPRLLIIRVGDRWYALDPAIRKAQATAWRDLWHHNVPGGIIAVLDAGTGKPVVQFGPQGKVDRLGGPPAPPGRAAPP